MPYAITLGMDNAAARKIEKLYQLLAEKNISSDEVKLGYHPHITLAIHDDSANASLLVENLRKASEHWTETLVEFSTLGTFKGMSSSLFVRPAVTPDLLQKQQAVYEVLPRASLHEHYKPDKWIPHVTLAKDLATDDALRMAVEAASAKWQPIEATLNSLELIRFRPVHSIWKSPLKKNVMEGLPIGYLCG